MASKYRLIIVIIQFAIKIKFIKVILDLNKKIARIVKHFHLIQYLNYIK